MSRIGKKPITIPAGVTVTIKNGIVCVKGPKGELSRSVKDNFVQVTVENNIITLASIKSSQEAAALWGTYASHIKNMIQGVTEGFEKKLEVEGVGYRAQLRGDTLVLNLGFSHPIEIKPKEGIAFRVEKNSITVSGIDKERVGETASYIRSLRKPEPYKGKGIRYAGEVVRRKAGKKAVSSGG